MLKRRDGLKGCCFILLAVEGMKQNETPGIEGKRQASILLLLFYIKPSKTTLGGGGGAYSAQALLVPSE
jgi:hypothetical protein